MNVPEFLGHYEIIQRLGSGAYSETYRALDVTLNRTVALKLLKPDALPKGLDPNHFLEYAQPAVDLVHPHLAWLWETGEEDGFYYLSERFIDGKSLAETLVNPEPLGYQQTLKITAQIAQGLEFAHTRGWVHGDIKPSNIMLHPELGAVLTGFGPALAIQALSKYMDMPYLWGGGGYTAPEIWQGQPPSAASDQYALACILAEALSGERLFDAPTLDEIKEKHLANFEAPLNWSVLVPWPAAKTIKRALDHDPARRFPGIRTFSNAPEKLAIEMSDDPQVRKEIEQQARLWQERQEAIRQEQEEANRLTALEKAREEIEEEIQRQAQIPGTDLDSAEKEHIGSSPIAVPISKSRRRETRTTKRLRWLVWLALMIGITVLVGFWVNNRSTSGVDRLATTPVQTAAVIEESPTPKFSATKELENPVSPTVLPTAAPSRTPAVRKTKPLTPTDTSTSTPVLTPTPMTTFTPTHTPVNENNETNSSTYKMDTAAQP